MEQTFTMGEKIAGIILLMILIGAWWFVIKLLFKWITKPLKKWWNKRKAKVLDDFRRYEQQNAVNNESEE